MPEGISTRDAEYTLELVRRICTDVGPGLPGSTQERERAAIIQRELESHLGAENVLVEDLVLAPRALLGSQGISTLCMVIAALLNLSTARFAGISPWATAAAALAFSILSIALFLFEFVFGFEVVDRFFKKKHSVNVIGKLRKTGTETAKRLLVLSGHHDSAWEFTWLRFTGYGFFVLTATWMIGLLTMLVMSAIQLTGVITNQAGIVRVGTLGWVLLAYPIAPSIVYAMFFDRGRKNGGNVPGAADNLSASALAVATCRFLVNNPSYIPDDTEIRFISFGSEEAGCRGSRRYVHRHLAELKRLDVRHLNFETIAHPEMTILSSDANGTVKHCPEMVKSVVAAAERAGIPYKVQPATLGTGTDAGPFGRAGLKATALVAFKVPQMVAFYHQKWDSPDVLTIEPLLNVLKLVVEWICNDGE